MNDEVADRRRGQIETERLPALAVVERHVHAALRPGEQQAALQGILTHGVHDLVGRYARDALPPALAAVFRSIDVRAQRSDEHTSELQSRLHLVCRLMLEKKKNTKTTHHLSVDTHV